MALVGALVMAVVIALLRVCARKEVVVDMSILVEVLRQSDAQPFVLNRQVFLSLCKHMRMSLQPMTTHEDVNT